MSIINGGSRIVVSRAAFVIAGGLIAGFVSGAAALPSPVHSSGSPRPGRVVELSSMPAEFAKMPATYRPPSFNPKVYKLCREFMINNVLINGEFPAGTPLSSYVSGVSDAAKQGNAVVTGLPSPAIPDPALLIATGRHEGYDVGQIPKAPDGHTYQCVWAAAHLDYHGREELPPMRVTFLGFGFQPVTATVTLQQVGSGPVTLLGYQDQGTGNTGNQTAQLVLIAVAHLRLIVSDVSVRGVPLDVGHSCRTNGTLTTPGNGVDPSALVLVGGDALDDPEPDAVNAAAGGALAGLASIPPLTGCISSSGENLDALLTASVSGPRNYVQVDEGTPCTGFGYGTCTRDKMPLYGPNYSVTHGGDYVASSPPATSQGAFQIISAPFAGFTMTCNTSTISGSFPDAAPPVRGAFATVMFSNISGCTDNSGVKYSITSSSTIYFSGLLTYSPETHRTDPGVIYGALDHLKFTITGPQGCEEVLTGYIQTEYDNSGAAFKVDPAHAVTSAPMSLVPGKPQCPNIIPTSDANDFTGYGITGDYNLGPAKPVITNGLP